MQFYRCDVRKADNPGVAVLAVYACDELDVVITVQKEYGEHLMVSNVRPLPPGTTVQIGGDLIAVKQQ